MTIFVTRTDTSLTIPDRRGLIGEWITRIDAATAKRNLARRPEIGTLTGSPTFDSTSMTMAGGTLNTGCKADSRSMTAIIIAKKPSSNGWMFANGAAFGFYRDSSSNMSCNNSQTQVVPDVANIAWPSASDYFIAFARGNEGQLSQIAVMSGGSLVKGTDGTVAGGVRGYTPMVFQGPTQYVYGALFGRYLSDAMLVDIGNSLRDRFGGEVTIV